MRAKLLISYIVGGIVRYMLLATRSSKPFAERVEVSTPINAHKRVQEGIYLYKSGIDPYKGDVVHETPVVLVALANIFGIAPQLTPLLYILLDLLTGVVLYELSRHFISIKLSQQDVESKDYAAGTEELQLHPEDIERIPRLVLLAHLFNPLSVLNCAALTSTVITNLFLAIILLCLSKRLLLPCIMLLALETLRNLYPMVLVAPLVLTFGSQSKRKAFSIVALFTAICCGILVLSNVLVGSWSFLDGTLGFIFFYRDLQPNIGLFWYFFTEMFEHFRTMFLITFQMNATVLYLLPLSLKMRKEPVLLGTILIAVMAIFRSYPCVGDVSFYLALLPLWRTCWKFMAHKFLVVCIFLVTLGMLPAIWYLWIYAGSANANFYFGVTLAFSTGQIFLVTDLLFAYVKREFCLYNGQEVSIDGVEANIKLK